MGQGVLVCSATFSANKQFNLKRHYSLRHAAEYASCPERQKVVDDLKAAFNNDNEEDEDTELLARNPAVDVVYYIAWQIGKSGHPFSVGDIIKDCMCYGSSKLSPTQSAKYDAIATSGRTIARRINELADDLDCQLQALAKEFVYFSTALDESTDVSDTAQLSIFIRGVDDDFNVTEELLEIVPMHGTTKAEDIFNCFEESIDKRNLDWAKMSCFTGDGAPAMIGNKSGTGVRVAKKVRESGGDENIPVIHCFVHRENLCAKSSTFDHVMNFVLKTVNIMRAHGLVHRELIAFLNEVEAEFKDIPYHSAVRFLSRGVVLFKFFRLRREIKTFMSEKKKPASELDDPAFVRDLAFLADISVDLNQLNKILQGKNKLITELYDAIVGFQKQLLLSIEQLEGGNIDGFPCLKSLEEPAEDFQSDIDKYVTLLRNLKENFEKRFEDPSRFETEFGIFTGLFSFDVKKAPVIYQKELIYLQSNRLLKEKFILSDNLVSFYKTIPKDTFPVLRKLAAKIISMFASTYDNESSFSAMKRAKPRLRSNLSDRHLSSTMKQMCSNNLRPNISRIVEQKRTKSKSVSRSSSSSATFERALSSSSSS